MRIVQITDLHITPKGTITDLGIDTRRNLQEMLPRVQALHPDFVAITGDLCYMEADAPTYAELRELFDGLGCPYAVISGNHDSSAMMADAFRLPLFDDECYFTRTIEGQKCIFLDTAKATMSDTQLAWLRDELADVKTPALVFMHHPPTKAGMPFMDTSWPFLRSHDLLPILTRHPASVHVFCGHYHVERTIHHLNIHVHITPSCYFQLDDQSLKPALGHTNIALRVIEVADRHIFTSLHQWPGDAATKFF